MKMQSRNENRENEDEKWRNQAKKQVNSFCLETSSHVGCPFLKLKPNIAGKLEPK